jgi:hypothetical protein
MKKSKPIVKLIGQDGNAFAILAATKNSMKKAGWSREEIDEFFEEATSGDYDHLLQTVMKYCEVE